MAAEIIKHKKEDIVIMRGTAHSVKCSHLGPRKIKNCVGNTVSINNMELKAFNQGQMIIGRCKGCGFIGWVKKD